MAQNESDMHTLMLCETLGVVLSAEQLIDEALNDVITSEALAKRRENGKEIEGAGSGNYFFGSL